MTVHEANCVVKFSTWPSSGTTITNEGSSGATYNATSADNDYLLLASGATSFKTTDTTDKITIPTGAAIDNLAAITVEMGFRFDGQGTSGYPILYDKKQIPSGNAVAGTIYYLDIANGNFVVYRREQYNKYRNWTTPVGVITAGNWYDVQVSWNMSTHTNTPLVYINGVSQTMTDASDGGSDWVLDDGYNLTLGNRGDDNANDMKWTLTMFRLHNTNLSAADMLDNYAADKARWLDVTKVITTVPTTASASVSPAVVKISNPTYTQTTVKTTTTTVPAVVPSRICNPSYTEATVPTASTSVPTVVPSIIQSPTYTESTVPDTTTESISPTVESGITYIETAVPSTTTSVPEVVPSLICNPTFTEETVPTTTSESISPDISKAGAIWTQLIVPDVIAETQLVTLSLESNPSYIAVTVPTTVSFSITPDISTAVNATYTQSTVPDATTTSFVPDINVSKSWIQSVIPHTTTLVPPVLWGITDYIQSIVPTTITAVPVVIAKRAPLPSSVTVLEEPLPPVVLREVRPTRSQLVDAEHRIIIRNADLEDVGEITRFTKWQHTLKLNQISSWQIDMHTEDFESYDIDENTGILFYRDDELLIDGPIMPNGIQHTLTSGIKNTTIIGGCDLAFLRGRICYPVPTGPLFDVTTGNWRFGVQRSAVGINSPIVTQTSKDKDGVETSFGAKAEYEYDIPLIVENALGFVTGNTVMYLTSDGVQVTNWSDALMTGTNNYGEPVTYESALLTLAGVDFSTNTLTIAVPQQTPAVLAPGIPVGGRIYQTSGGIVDDPEYIGFDTQTGVADDVAKRLVWLNAGRGACADHFGTRAITHLEIAAPNSQGTEVTANSRGEDLLTQVQNVCLSGGINFHITQENKQFLFDTYVGADLSIDGNLIFSREMGNLKEYTYTYGPPIANFVWGCGPTTGPHKEMLPSANIQSIKDYGRWESWISAVQAVKDATNAEIAESMVQANNLALAQSIVNAQLTMTIQETDQVRYPRDFSLGDKVGIDIGEGKKKRVNEIITTLMYSIPGETGASQGSALMAVLTKQETRQMLQQQATKKLLQQMSMV